MAIEIISKKEQEKTSSTKVVVYYLFLFIIAASILASLIFFFLDWRFSQEAKALEQAIKQGKTDEVIALERKIGSYNKRINLFLDLNNNRDSSQQFFAFIEQLIHPEVVLVEFQADTKKGEIKGLAVAKNIVAFDQQTKIIKNQVNQKVNSFDIFQFKRLDDGEIEFPFTIKINKL